MHTRPFCPRQLAVAVLAVTSGVPFSPAVLAQSESRDFRLEEVIVTARRREESLQSVPISINAVSGDMIEELNIQNFEDIQAIIPGLTLESSLISGTASLRGVRFDTFASISGTVEFYMNDAYTVNTAVLQSMYDISQVEVLRGPQGTLRGKASPSGSITLSTVTPNVDEFGGELSFNVDDADGHRVWAALNVPVVEDTFAARIAGLFNEDKANQVDSINTDVDPRSQTTSERLSLAWLPTDTISLDFMYHHLELDQRTYSQVESANLADSSLPASATLIKPSDRKGVTNIPVSAGQQEFDIYNLRASWELGTSTLYYVGQYLEYTSNRKQADDIGDFFDDRFSDAFQTVGQDLRALESETETHEIRLQSDEPLFDRLDYVIGGFYAESKAANDLISETPIIIGLDLNPDAFSLVNETPITTDGKGVEKSLFGNLTWHFGENTELSAGTRYITFDNTSTLTLSGNALDIAAVDDDFDTWVYSASLTHQFTDDLMSYVSVGTSWRPGNNVIGDFNEQRSELENSFLVLPPEESTSYEIGMKSTWMDGRLRLNAAAFYQEFEDYPYRVPNSGVYYVSTTNGVDTVSQFNFVGPVPVDVQGLELEGYFLPTENWYISGTIAYAKSEIDDGLIPCNDYFPADGIPDTSGQIPTVDDIRSRTGGDNLTGCNVDFSVNFAPEWSGTVQSEYSFPIGDFELYLRGQASVYGDSDNDESNSLDDVDSYSILNLFTGLRSAEGKWEIMLYGNNVLDTERVLNRGATPASIGYQAVDLTAPGGPAAIGMTGVSDYREITMTAPREFGVNFRFSF